MSTSVKREYDERIVTVPTADGRMCNVINVRGRTPPTRLPVLLVHGAGVRANIFRAPVDQTLVDYLIARGHDVWLENWRASIDFPPNEWNLDQAAVFDHPATVRAVVAETGSSEINAVIHCQGSTSFMMSAMAGLVPQVRTVVSNAVSLHTVVPRFSWLKFQTALPAIGLVTPYLNPHWGVSAPGIVAKILTGVVKLTHHECHNTVCKWVSFTYGSGFPALWSHEHLNDETHEWLKEEFAEVPISFFHQIGSCIRRGHLVSTGTYKALPKDFARKPPETDARFAFFAGEKNRCFLPEGQRKTFKHFDKMRRGYHTLHTFPTYGHLDMFMGKNAAADVFPTMARELERELPA